MSPLTSFGKRSGKDLAVDPVLTDYDKFVGRITESFSKMVAAISRSSDRVAELIYVAQRMAQHSSVILLVIMLEVSSKLGRSCRIRTISSSCARNFQNRERSQMIDNDRSRVSFWKVFREVGPGWSAG